MRRILFVLLVLVGAPGAAQAATLPAGAPLTEAFAETLLDEALEAHFDGPFTLALARPRLPLANPSAKPTEIDVEQLSYDPGTGSFAAVLVGRFDDALRFRLPARGRVLAMIEVPVPARTLGAGTRVAEDDLDMVAMRASRVPPGALVDTAELVGAEARRRLAAGRPVRGRDLQAPQMVRRGEAVRLIYERPGLRLSALGTAEDDGALGELVRVRNADSRQRLQGVVTGPDEVTVESTLSP